MRRDAQRKHPAGGMSEQFEPITMRNTGDAQRNQPAPQRDKSSIDRGRPSLDRVINESEDSFPASDPPSWSPTTAGSPCGENGEPCEEDAEEMATRRE